MKTVLSFEDVLMVPKYSSVKSRKLVDPSTTIAGDSLDIPIISANMDSVTGSLMAKAMGEAGARGCLHRFLSIEDNLKEFKAAPGAWVSLGLGDKELERAEALYHAGATVLLVDVAHGASDIVVETTKRLHSIVKYNASIIVGNFATAANIKDFIERVGKDVTNTFKIGIGGGSACLTRVVTGCGLPTLASIMDCSQIKGIELIADGGIKTSGDFAKALAAGASAVMMGGQLAGAEESLAPTIQFSREIIGYEIFNTKTKDWCLKPLQDYQFYEYIYGFEPRPRFKNNPVKKKYRGSASQESYEVQGKIAEWRAPEGDSFEVPYSGPVKETLQKYDAGLRSAMSYLNANTLQEMRENVEFVKVTVNGAKESGAHGKVDL